MNEYVTKVITASDGSAESQLEAHGWGDERRLAKVNGRPLEITVSRNGQTQFGFQIGDDGQLIITDYAGLNYQAWVPQNLVLRATRPWEDGEQPKGDE